MSESKNKSRKLSKKSLVAIALCVVLVLAIGISVGASLYNPKVVMTVDGDDVKAGVYLYYQQAALVDLYSDIYLETGVTPFSVDQMLGSSFSDGTTLRELLPAKIDQMVREAAFVEDELDRLGIGMDSADIYYYDYLASEQWAEAAPYYLENGISYESFSKCYIGELHRSLLFDALYLNEDSEHYITEEEVKEYYATEYVGYDLVTMPSTNGDSAPLSEDEVKAVTAVADKFADALAVEGADPTEVFTQLFPEALEAVGRSAELKDSTYNAYLSTDNVTFYADTGKVNVAIMDGLRAAEVGESGVVTVNSANGSTFVFVYIKRDHTEGDGWAERAVDIAELMKSEEFLAYIAEGAEAYETTIDTRAAKYYSPDKIFLG